MPDTELAEPERAEELLRALDLGELARGDGRAVRDPRREAGHRGLVPRLEAVALRERADLLFVQARVGEGPDHAVLGRRLHAGAELAQVVGGETVGDRDDLFPRLELAVERLEQLALAVVAALGRVLDVTRALELVRAELDQAHTERARDPAAGVELILRQALGARGDGEDVLRAEGDL